MEEIGLDTFIQAILIKSALEPSKIIPPSPEPETILGAETVSAPRASGVDKGKGAYISFPKKTPAMIPKGIVIGTPATSTPTPEEEEEEMPEDIGYALPATDVPPANLSEEEQLALALRASINTVREEQATRVASFIFDRPVCMMLYHFRQLHSLIFVFIW